MLGVLLLVAVMNISNLDFFFAFASPEVSLFLFVGVDSSMWWIIDSRVGSSVGPQERIVVYVIQREIDLVGVRESMRRNICSVCFRQWEGLTVKCMGPEISLQNCDGCGS